MRTTINLPSGQFQLSHPENDQDFEAIIQLNLAVHEAGIDLLCRSLDRYHPGMLRRFWYAITRPGETEVLSTLCLIPGQWRYRTAGVECLLPTAEMGLVATAESARGLGLSSFLIKQFMQDARAEGFLLSTIMGIPYYYHRFGYEYALPLLVKQQLLPEQIPDGPIPQTRPVTAADLPMLEAWYNAANQKLDIYAQRDAQRWQYLCGGALESPATAIERRVVLDDQEEPVGFIGLQRDCFGPTLAVVEASLPTVLAQPTKLAQPARGTGSPGAGGLQADAATRLADSGTGVAASAGMVADTVDGQPGGLSAAAFLRLAEQLRQEYGLPHVSILLAETHPVSQAAAEITGKAASSYGWQVAVLDAAALLERIRPVLAVRLSASEWAGQALRLTLGLYGNALRLDWDGKTLTCSAGNKPPADSQERHSDGQPKELDLPEAEAAKQPSELPGLVKLGAEVPPELLSPLILGFRTVDELAHCRLDLSASADARRLLDVLFPRLNGFIYPAY